MSSFSYQQNELLDNAAALLTSGHNERAAAIFLSVYYEVEDPFLRQFTLVQHAIALVSGGTPYLCDELNQFDRSDLPTLASRIFLFIRPYEGASTQHFEAFLVTARILQSLFESFGLPWPSRKVKKTLKSLGMSYDDLFDISICEPTSEHLS